MIQEATNASFDAHTLLASLNHLDTLYTRAGFNDEARSGFLRVTVTKIPPLDTFEMYRIFANYGHSKQANRHFESVTRAFLSICRGKMTMDSPLDDQKEKEVKSLVRPDSGVQNMESKSTH